MRWKSIRRSATLGVVALLSGGSLFTSCHSIWRDAIFQGTERFVLSLLDPATIIDSLDGSADEQ